MLSRAVYEPGKSLLTTTLPLFSAAVSPTDAADRRVVPPPPPSLHLTDRSAWLMSSTLIDSSFSTNSTVLITCKNSNNVHCEQVAQCPPDAHWTTKRAERSRDSTRSPSHRAKQQTHLIVRPNDFHGVSKLPLDVQFELPPHHDFKVRVIELAVFVGHCPRERHRVPIVLRNPNRRVHLVVIAKGPRSDVFRNAGGGER